MAQSIVEAIPIPALLLDQYARIAQANASGRRIFGDRIVGRHYITVLRQPNLLDAVERALQNGTTTQAQYLTTEARRDITLEAVCAPLDHGQMLISLQDQTAFEETFQMRRDFVANVSHELRTPLTALLGLIETLGGAAKDDEIARDRFLGTMAKEAERMNRLVGDLLSLSRVEAEERLRPTDPINLNAIVQSVVHTLAPLAERARITIKTATSLEPSMLQGDEEQLTQVAANLVENAIKYSRPGGTVDISVSIVKNHAMLRADAIIFTVKDDGEGIDPDHIPRLTERFYRVDSHRSREKGGTGLGLAIVKHVVNRHRGRLRIQSELGKGSTFTVILPLLSVAT